MSKHSVSVPRTPRSPALSSPLSPPLRAAASSAPLPYHTRLWPGACRSGPARDQHVALSALWVGEVSLLQNDHGVEDMPVQEVHLHCRPRRHLSQVSLHQAAMQAYLLQERHSESPRPSPCGWGDPSPSCLCHLPMLSHQMTCQGSRLQ